MLAIVTHNGTSLIDPTSFKNLPTSFPVSSSLECFTSIWCSDTSQLYLANSSSIKRYTPSESLLEVLYSVSDPVTCLAMKDNSNTLFFAAGNKVWSLDCTNTPRKALSSLESHKNTVTKISVSNDGTLLASVSASAVFVHDLTLSTHVRLNGLLHKGAVTCCMFHRYSRTRLLLGVGQEVVIYDSTQPSAPLKTVRIPGGADIMDIAASPFSKTLVSIVTSNGEVVLVDLDKDNGILKTVNLKTPLTCCSFTAEGAAIYLGTETGKLLILDLRSLEKEPKSFTIGDGGAAVKEISVQGKSKSNAFSTKSNSAVVASSSPKRPVSAIRVASTSSAIVGRVVRSPVRVTVASRIRGGGGVTPKKKLLSSVRTPLSEAKNLGLDAQLATSHSPTVSRRVKPLKLQRNEEQEENRETLAQPPSPTSRRLGELASTRQRTKPSSPLKIGLGLGSASESISGHLAAMRVHSGPPLNSLRDHGDQPKATTRRIASESVESALIGRKPKATSTASGHSKTASSKDIDGTTVRTREKQERRSTTPDNSDEYPDLSSPELPREPVTPIPLGKKAGKGPVASATSSEIGILGLTGPEVARWALNKKGKGKGRKVEVKKTRFSKELSGGSDEQEGEGDPEIPADEAIPDEEQEQKLSLQISPRRPTATPTWLQSPHRPSAANLNMNTAAQEFLRGIVHDVMYDLQRETKAEMMGLHLDLVRMGRGWKHELREVMEEWNKEIQELKAENRRLKAENERLRRGYN